MKKAIKIRKVVKDLGLEVVAGEKGLDYVIETEMINQPGFEIMGQFDYSDQTRVMVIGTQEAKVLNQMDKKKLDSTVQKLVEFRPPAIIFSNVIGTEEIITPFKVYGEEFNVSILKSNLRTTPLISRMFVYLHRELSQTIGVHGVLMDINGTGTLIIGASGIGKSETALELIKRGHILISDDLVEIYESTAGRLVGSAPKILQRFLEIRGIGIVDVISMFGSGAYRENKRINMVVELEYWQKDKEYDRLGISGETIKYINTEVPKITIPVLPGRNIATLVESAAMNEKLKKMGYNAAITFTQSVSRHAKGDFDDE